MLKCLLNGRKKLTKIAIVCFKKELIDEIEKNDEFKEYSKINVCGDNIKIYKKDVDGKEVMIYITLVGGPATTAMMEELHARGVETFIFFWFLWDTSF